MGCAAVRGKGATQSTPSTDETDKSVSQPPVAPTWATKIGDDANTKAPAAGSTTSPSGSPKKPNSNLVMQDADDDDEIEIIYEQNPQAKRPKPQEPQMIAAANGQEAPEASESSRQKKAEAPSTFMQQQEQHEKQVREQEAAEAAKKLQEQKQQEAARAEALSVKQQQEAAQLAERRKKFDNQRYQQQAVDGVPGQDMPGTVTSLNQVPLQQSSQPYPSMANSKPPESDVGNLFGLNQAQASSQEQPFCDQNAFIPGGIFDELEAMAAEPMQTSLSSGKKKIHTHDDVDSKGFDADDEQMMADILQELDDI